MALHLGGTLACSFIISHPPKKQHGQNELNSVAVAAMRPCDIAPGAEK